MIWSGNNPQQRTLQFNLRDFLNLRPVYSVQAKKMSFAGWFPDASTNCCRPWVAQLFSMTKMDTVIRSSIGMMIFSGLLNIPRQYPVATYIQFSARDLLNFGLCSVEAEKMSR